MVGDGGEEWCGDGGGEWCGDGGGEWEKVRMLRSGSRDVPC